MEFARAEVGLPRGIRADIVAQPFEFSATHVGEILARGRGGGTLVEVDRYAELGGHPRAELSGEGDTVLHRGALERDERHHVGGPDARMLTPMRGQIDALLRDRHRREGGRDRRLERGDEGDHRAMMRWVAGDIEQVGTRRTRDRVANRGDHHRVAALGEIRDAFDERHDQAG